MGKAEPKTRTIVEQVAEQNPSPSSPIRSLSLSSTHIYAGTDSGSLLLLSLPSLSLERYALVSRFPITQIHVVGHEGQILVLSGGAVYVVDSGLLKPVAKLLGFKGEVSALASRVFSPGVVHRDIGSDLSSTVGRRFLQKFGDKVIAAIDPKKVDILQRYLQWLIEDQDSEDIQFHTTYALLLAKSAFESFETENANQGSAAGDSKKLNMLTEGKNKIFESSVRERLQIFLQSSELYDPEEVLDLIEGSELWLEKAILYKRLGQETLVLQILALKLEDSEAAEHYCAEIGRPDAYMQLLEMYLDPKDGKEPMFKAAVRLLHNHGESLDPLKVLERLSPDMPLQLASDTILRMLRARVHHHRQGQIEHNLSRALHVDASVAGLEERSRNVQINDECLCDSCHAHLGTKLFAMYPDDTIVCYKCFRRLGEFKSVTGRDFKQDPMFKAGWLVTP